MEGKSHHRVIAVNLTWSTWGDVQRQSEWGAVSRSAVVVTVCFVGALMTNCGKKSIIR